ncbi:TolC family outer membrane protein [Aquicoccus porphyridii]|uniref:TolC family outer membrane protein n=1 Tax=Aquicoccus porphyridii TaxID=1852029 RepID=UPI00273F237F|nr:TolC family outer membrane protein [Aquicoccus porphyridii]
MKRKPLARLVAAAVLAFAVPVMSHAETVADTMAAAYQHNGLIEQNRALLRAADEDVAIAVSALKPILNWSADMTYSRGRSFTPGTMAASRSSSGTDATIGLAAELLLYDFGRSKIGIDVQKETVLATRQALVSAEQQVLLRAATAFFEVQRRNEFVRLRQNNVRVISEQLRAARDRFEVGEVTRTDVSLAEARLAGARAALAAAQGQLAQANEEFRAAVGRKPGQLSGLGRVPATAKSVDAAKAVALRNHPEMLKVQHEVTATELAILAAEAGMKPQVKLTGRYGLTQNLDDRGFSNGGSIGVEIGGPIYQGGRLSALARQAMARRDQARAGLHVVRHNIALAVGNAWAGLQVARASRDASERQVRAAREAFRGVREEATLGARTTLDVLDAEQELLDAQTNLASAMVDEHVGAYNLLSAMGYLTAERLNLRVPRYDPAAYYNLVKDAPAKRSRQGQQLDKALRSLGKQ